MKAQSIFKMKWTQENTNNVKILIVTGIILLIFYFLNIGCLVRNFLHFYCPGCGLTRAMLAFLHGDVVAAFNYHPCYGLVILAIPIFIFAPQMNKKVVDAFLIFSIIAVLSTYFIRIINGSIFLL